MIEAVPLRVLHIEDSESDAQLVAAALQRAGFDARTRRVTTPDEFQAALQQPGWEVVLADYRLPHFDAMQALALLQASGQDLPFIIVSGAIDEEQAVTALRTGAHDFVTKSRLARLAPAIERERREAGLRRQARQAQDRLRKQESNFRLLFENNPLPMWLYDQENLAFLEVNRSAIAHYGYSRDEFLKMRLTDIRPPEDVPALLANVRAQPENFRPVERNWRHRLKSGQIIDVDIAAHAMEFRGRAAVLVVAYDVTERTRAEASAAHSERRFRALIEKSADGLALITADGEVVYASPATARILGQTPDYWIGGDIRNRLHPEEATQFAVWMEELLQRPGASVNVELRYRRFDETWCWLEATATNLVAEPGVNAVVINFRDITERKAADAKIQNQLERLGALRAIDLALTSSLDLQLTLGVLLDQVINRLGVHAADILLADSEGDTFTYTAGRGFRSSFFEQARVRLGEGRAGRAALERRVVGEIKDRQAHPPSPRTGLLWYDEFVSYFGVPLIAKGQVLGILEIFHRTPLQPDHDWLEFLEALAAQAAIALENARLFGDLERSNQELVSAYDTTLAGWSAALDLRDKETEGHSRRVTELTLRLAEAFNFTPAELLQVRRGALLHDIGKIAIPDRILLKPGPLSDDEWASMRRHPIHAYELISPIAYLRPALDIPYCHHEKWDGTGYPNGLRGAQIPLAARLFAVVDVWDALSSERPYRPAWPRERVLAHIRSLAGSHLDPRAVEAFFRVIG